MSVPVIEVITRRQNGCLKLSNVPLFKLKENFKFLFHGAFFIVHM